MINDVVAERLKSLATLLALEDKEWESRAYSDARETVLSLDEPVSKIYEEGGEDGLEELPAVGETIASNIAEFLETGSIAKLSSLQDRYPGDIETILNIRGLGPKTAKHIIESLNIESLAGLKEAAENNELQTLDGIGSKTEENILSGIKAIQKRQTNRFLRHVASTTLNELLPFLNTCEAVTRAEPVGSYRRQKETVGDIDILIETDESDTVVDHIKGYEYLEDIEEAGSAKCRFTLRNGVAVDTRFVDRSSWGTALQYFTGSKDHNIAVRRLAEEQGLSLSEYALRDVASGEENRFSDEESVYAALGLQYIPSELRQGRDEVRKAKNKDLPVLVNEQDIRGDLHLHTAWSDGGSTIDEMVQAGKERSYDYIAITDHSQSSGFAGGLGAVDLRSHHETVKAADEKEASITVLSGSEVDILPDGTLDYDDEVLAMLDIVVVGLHSDLAMDEESMTKRVVTALENPYVTCLAHPSGRLINRRDPASMDYRTVFQAAADNGVAIEINSNPNRLDVNDRHARMAKDLGCSFLINTDSHDDSSLSLMEYGVGQARRAGLTSEDILNTKPLRKWLPETTKS